MDNNITQRLKELSTSELTELHKEITRILDEREVSEDVIRDAISYLADRDPLSIGIRYTKLTLHLEKHGLRREAIARRIVDMWKKNPSIAEGGCPIGEEETAGHPIYPHVDEVRYYQICYLKKRLTY